MSKVAHTIGFLTGLNTSGKIDEVFVPVIILGSGTTCCAMSESLWTQIQKTNQNRLVLKQTDDTIANYQVLGITECKVELDGVSIGTMDFYIVPKLDVLCVLGMPFFARGLSMSKNQLILEASPSKPIKVRSAVAKA